MLDTKDILTAKRIVGEVLPLLIPISTAVVAYATHQMSGASAIVSAANGTITALWLWSRKSPFVDGGELASVASTPPPPPMRPGGEPTQSGDIHTATTEPEARAYAGPAS